MTAVHIIAYRNNRKLIMAIFSVDCWENLHENGRFRGAHQADFWSNRFHVVIHKCGYKAFYAKCDHIPAKRVLYLVPAILQQATSHRCLRSDKMNALFSEDTRRPISKDTPDSLSSWTHIIHIEVYVLFTGSISSNVQIQ